jgi:hypothetical protein
VDDARHGQLCATILAPHMKKGQHANPRDFMFRQPAEREMTTEETEAMLDTLFGVGPATHEEPALVRAPAQE